MDQQKKQKVMIAVLAVAILGAGTFFWMSSSTKQESASFTTDGPIVRRQRETPADGADSAPKRRQAAPDRRKADSKTTITRRERSDTDDTKITRRRGKRDDERKTKKVEQKPMG